MTSGTSQPTPRPPPLDLRRPTLACAASIDELLEQVADGRANQRDDHQARCPHCQAALLELVRLWAPVQQLAHQPVIPPAGVVAAVMRHIDRLTHDVWYTLHLADAGAIRVATRVVATIARQAALRVPGVRIAFGRSSGARTAKVAETGTRQHRHPHAAVGVLGRTAVVDLALTITYGESIDHVARQVQQSVIDDLRRTIGLQHVAVNITVDDVLPHLPDAEH
jgi:uncharacterized alkaline shock family protein YloU